MSKVEDKVKKIVERLNEKMGEMTQKMHEAEEEAAEKISVAKSRLMQMEPFFALLLFKMPCVPAWWVPTVATDGICMMYNPFFVKDLMRKDLVFVMMHEIEHVFLKHHIRGPIKLTDYNQIAKMYEKTKDVVIEDQLKILMKKLKKWNWAGDYVINWHIKNETKIQPTQKLLEDMLYDDKFKDDIAEQVYKKLDDPPDQNCDSCSQGISGSGSGDSPDGVGIGDVLPVGLGELEEKEIRQAIKELEGNVKQAAIVAKKAGKLPDYVVKAIEDMYTTTTPWQDVFRTIFSQICKQDYTFRIPNRRYTMYQVEQGVFMPSLFGEEYTDVAFFMDTSGSVSDHERAILASELRQILEDYNIRLHVYFIDTELKNADNPEVLTREDIQQGKLRLEFKGYGGTDFRPAFDFLRNKTDIEFETVIYMTDMCPSSWNLGPEPECSVYWARLPNSDKKVKPPFGVCIDIQLAGEKNDS